jgi:multidrug transporter EmrE-like cation transporter
MTLASGFGAMFACFCVVALRAFQQQNVIHGYYKVAVVTSYLLAFADIAIVLSVVSMGWAAALWIGTGGALGVTFAMYTHAKYIQKPKVKGELH